MDAVSKYKPKQDNEKKLLYYLNKEQDAKRNISQKQLGKS